MEQLGIVGAGPGGAELLRTFLAIPGIKIIGIADPNPNSPGMKIAQEHRLFSTADYRDLAGMPGKKMLFDATGVPAVAQGLRELADENTIVVCPDTARLIWQMVEAKEEVNKALLAESTSLLSFIESGLEHLEVLNDKHGAALEDTVRQIETLSQTTASSHKLLQETEQIMALIKNVADKTRILGINAAIESARAGDLGRGFGVVADSIHELAASSVASVQFVSKTIDAIHEALRVIGEGVNDLVIRITDIESNQNTLTQELHTTLEEMIESAEKLKVIAGEK
ncbi:MAG TPA: hypothetical protein GX528_05625 [Firmicutes bacterium]|nr:hypothetical protein [Bacillota bacterium]